MAVAMTGLPAGVEHVTHAGMQLPFFADHQLQTLHPTKLREHAMLLYRTLGHQVIGSAVPISDAELFGWIMTVQRTHLGHLRFVGYGQSTVTTLAPTVTGVYETVIPETIQTVVEERVQTVVPQVIETMVPRTVETVVPQVVQTQVVQEVQEVMRPVIQEVVREVAKPVVETQTIIEMRPEYEYQERQVPVEVVECREVEE